MKYYEAPRIVFGMFSSENIITGSKTDPDPMPEKTNLNVWLSDNKVDAQNHIVINMGE